MQTRLFVRNLAPSVDLATLEDMFSSVGDVEVSEFAQVPSQGPLRSAYVKMRTEDAIKDCIDRFNGQELKGFSLIVTRDEPHQPNPQFKSRKRGGL